MPACGQIARNAPGSRHLLQRMQRGEPSSRPQVINMQRLGILAAVGALGLATLCPASDKWDAQDPTAWSHDTVYKLMHDSPWAHAGKVKMENSRSDGMNRGGGQFPNDRNDPNNPNDPNGGNYPNDSRYPGGGNSRRGGISMPGGIGLPFPGGGGGMGRPGNRGGGRGGDPRGGPMTTTVLVRWESALPMRLAYAQQEPDGHPGTSDAAEAAKAPGWHKADEPPAAGVVKPVEAAGTLSQPVGEYIIAVDGFPLTSSSPYSRHRADSDSSRSGDSTSNKDDERDNSQHGGRDPEVIREELMQRTTISRGTGRSLRPVKVEFDLPGKTGIIYFHFSREDEITLKDKELEFETQLGDNRLERKFETKEMVYRGKLEL